MKRVFILTNDVEEFSIIKNRLDDITANLVFQEGLPHLLSLYDKHSIKATFYFTGTFVEKFPKSTRQVKDRGHEVGCHGYSHERYFDVLSPKEQMEDLKKAKRIIENEVGPIEAFRAPALRINRFTVRVLEECGFKTDSSVCPQRFEGPFSLGMRYKLGWLKAPRKPYFLSYTSPFREGDSSVLEVPLLSLLLGCTGTVMRVNFALFRIIYTLLLRETSFTCSPTVFLFHPNEIINERNIGIKPAKRTHGLHSIFFDYLKRRIKLKNLGENSLILLDNMLCQLKIKNVNFIKMDEYRRLLLTRKNK